MTAKCSSVSRGLAVEVTPRGAEYPVKHVGSQATGVGVKARTVITGNNQQSAAGFESGAVTEWGNFWGNIEGLQGSIVGDIA